MASSSSGVGVDGRTVGGTMVVVRGANGAASGLPAVVGRSGKGTGAVVGAASWAAAEEMPTSSRRIECTSLLISARSSSVSGGRVAMAASSSSGPASSSR